MASKLIFFPISSFHENKLSWALNVIGRYELFTLLMTFCVPGSLDTFGTSLWIWRPSSNLVEQFRFRNDEKEKYKNYLKFRLASFRFVSLLSDSKDMISSLWSSHFDLCRGFPFYRYAMVATVGGKTRLSK